MEPSGEGCQQDTQAMRRSGLHSFLSQPEQPENLLLGRLAELKLKKKEAKVL